MSSSQTMKYHSIGEASEGIKLWCQNKFSRNTMVAIVFYCPAD